MHFYTLEYSEPQLSEMLGDDYLYFPVIPTPDFLLKKLVLPSVLDTAI